MKIEEASATREKIRFKPGNMLYPVPAVMVTCGRHDGESNIITIAWAGTVCSNPPMVSISVRPDRYSYHLIKETGAFAVNLVTEPLTRAMDYCGVRSGRDHDKWKECSLTPVPAETIDCPLIEESPVNIECKVVSEHALGSHHMFLAEVTAVQVDGRYMDERGKFDLNAAGLVAYSHGTYFSLGEQLGTFGYSVKKTPAKKAAVKKKMDAKKMTEKKAAAKKTVAKKIHKKQ
ncbi:MAG: flavin reductase family protein [Lachnospiraceae bacterium]|nr:flavin reductase family protein [Lachnospiraceae bacterium]